MPDTKPVPEIPLPETTAEKSTVSETAGKPVEEIGGREGPDPTRYGDWEKNGRCIDF
ncbi:MAG: DUF1674 domain-containing protein [Gammaproteobacteria bacterium]|nr:MAG: DUF1674 domain-containing protein [Gammaproteobacteria bacterium]